jgi:vacuolar protein sorting-associated protein 45
LESKTTESFNPKIKKKVCEIEFNTTFQDEKSQTDKKIDEMVLSSKQDSFFNLNKYSNWGDLCVNIKKMMDVYQKSHQTTAKISSFDDIRNFLSNFPEFKKEASTVDKHVTLVYRLKEEITKRQLLSVSKLEQEIVCGNDHTTVLNDLKQLLPSIDNDDDSLKLVILYALRYENYKYNEIKNLIDYLERKGLEKSVLKVVQYFLKYGGSSVRNPGTFSWKFNFKVYSQRIQHSLGG